MTNNKMVNAMILECNTSVYKPLEAYTWVNNYFWPFQLPLNLAYRNTEDPALTWGFQQSLQYGGLTMLGNMGPNRCLNMVKYADSFNMTLKTGVKDEDSLRGSNNLIMYNMPTTLRGSTNSASREMSVKQLPWQPDRLRQQRMTRKQPKSQPPTGASWYRPTKEQQRSPKYTQNTLLFWSCERSTTDRKQEAHVVYTDQHFKVMSGQQSCQLMRGCEKLTYVLYTM